MHTRSICARASAGVRQLFIHRCPFTGVHSQACMYVCVSCIHERAQAIIDECIRVLKDQLRTSLGAATRRPRHAGHLSLRARWWRYSPTASVHHYRSRPAVVRPCRAAKVAHALRVVPMQSIALGQVVHNVHKLRSHRQVRGSRQRRGQGQPQVHSAWHGAQVGGPPGAHPRADPRL